MSNKKYAVEVENVTKSFYLPNHKNDSLKKTITQAFKKKEKGGNTFQALDGVSFKVESGDFFGILGRNGSGKSTLLKIISQIYQPTSGSVSHKGKLVSFIELGVGFKSELSGRENVYLNGALLGFSYKEIGDMYDDIVKFAELERFMDQKLKNYSSGMKVRLAFSVAIRAKADTLVLDEVLAVGDADFQRKCYNYFKGLKDSKKTIIFVTHSMSQVKEFCNKAVLIEDGKVVHEGEASYVADEYTKLFNPPKLNDKKKKFLKERQGTGRIEISSIRTENNKTTIDIIIDLDNKHISSPEEVTIAIDIFDTRGKLVGGLGSHKIQEGSKVKIPKDGNVSVKFSVDNIFGTGDFNLTIALRGKSNEVYDLWRGAASFSNKTKNDESSYFPIILPASMSVNVESKKV